MKTLYKNSTSTAREVLRWPSHVDGSVMNALQEQLQARRPLLINMVNRASDQRVRSATIAGTQQACKLSRKPHRFTRHPGRAKGVRNGRGCC